MKTKSLRFTNQSHKFTNHKSLKSKIKLRLKGTWVKNAWERVEERMSWRTKSQQLAKQRARDRGRVAEIRARESETEWERGSDERTDEKEAES